MFEILTSFSFSDIPGKLTWTHLIGFRKQKHHARSPKRHPHVLTDGQHERKPSWSGHAVSSEVILDQILWAECSFIESVFSDFVANSTDILCNSQSTNICLEIKMRANEGSHSWACQILFKIEKLLKQSEKYCMTLIVSDIYEITIKRQAWPAILVTLLKHSKKILLLIKYKKYFISFKLQ